MAAPLTGADPAMRIATFNIYGIDGRIEILLRWLEETSPNIVCLQELKSTDVKFPIRQLEKVGYGAVWHGQRAWNGVAILAKGQEPILTRKGFLAIRMTNKAATSKPQSMVS